MKQSLSSLRPSSRSTIQTRTRTQTQTQIAMIRTCTYTCLWCVILAMFQSMTIINAYPMMIEVKENDRKCFNYNIPEDDDASFIVVAIPGDSESDNVYETQDYYIEEFQSLFEKSDASSSPKLGKLVDSIEQRIVEQGKKTKQRIAFSCAREQGQLIDFSTLTFYRPHVVHHIVDIAREKKFGTTAPLEGYIFCYSNKSNEIVTLLFDIYHWNEDLNQDDVIPNLVKQKKEEPKVITKEQHITPLEINFQKAFDSASAIMDQMRYMERRQHRNQEQEESIRSVVEKFSYLSVIVLVGTAFIQVSYLKRYFKKKKLL